MESLKYYYIFRSANDYYNRVDIYDTVNAVTSAEEVIPGDMPFVVEYPPIDKLEPMQGSSCKFNLIDNSLDSGGNGVGFKFASLYTTNKQQFKIKHKITNSLPTDWGNVPINWQGYLSSELYNENLTDSNHYVVEFQGSDLGVLKGVKYVGDNGAKYTNVAPLLNVIKLCLAKLNLYSDLDGTNINVNLNTYQADMSTADSSNVGITALNGCTINQANFYDEEGIAMNCYDVLDNVLRIFGASIVVKNNQIFIYDILTFRQIDGVESGFASFKRYYFNTLIYRDTFQYRTFAGTLDNSVGSTEASYEYDEPINNVELTASIYAKNDLFDFRVSEDDMSGDFVETDIAPNELYLDEFEKCKGWDSEKFILGANYDTGTGRNFHKLGQYDSTNNVEGFRITGDWRGRTNPIYPPKKPTDITFKSDQLFTPLGKDKNGKEQYYTLNWKGFVWYDGTANPNNEPKWINPFGTMELTKGRTVPFDIRLKCNIKIVGTSDFYYLNLVKDTVTNKYSLKWETNQGDDTYLIVFDWTNKSSLKDSDSIYNTWKNGGIKTYFIGSAYGDTFSIITNDIPSPPIIGYINIQITNCEIAGFTNVHTVYTDQLNRIRGVYINDLSITHKNYKGQQLSTDNSTFQSYIDPNTESSYSKELLVCSAYDKEHLIGKANLIGRTQVSGSTDVKIEPLVNFKTTVLPNPYFLEEHLLCQIHNQYTGKFPKFNLIIATPPALSSASVPVHNNPIMGYCKYSPVPKYLPNPNADKTFLINGCEINYGDSTTRYNCVGFNIDTFNDLSDINYGG